MAEVERFSPQIAGATDEGFLPMDQTVDGEWVRYSDYEKLEDERGFQTQQATDYHDRALVAEKKLKEAEAQRDSLRSQVDAEVKRLQRIERQCTAASTGLRRNLTAEGRATTAKVAANRLQAILDSTGAGAKP